jgi:general secretion pathway protein D
MRKTFASCILIFCSVLMAPLFAQDSGPAGSSPRRPAISLESLLERVEARPAKRFLIDLRASPDIYIGGTENAADITYPILLSILRANDLAAVEIEGIVNIVPVQEIRSYPVPIVDPDAKDIPDDEWVSTVVHLKNMSAPQAVPILRPLMPVEAHLAAMPPDTIMIVDRFANVQRIVALLGELDRPPAPSR